MSAGPPGASRGTASTTRTGSRSLAVLQLTEGTTSASVSGSSPCRDPELTCPARVLGISAGAGSGPRRCPVSSRRVSRSEPRRTPGRRRRQLGCRLLQRPLHESDNRAGSVRRDSAPFTVPHRVTRCAVPAPGRRQRRRHGHHRHIAALLARPADPADGVAEQVGQRCHLFNQSARRGACVPVGAAARRRISAGRSAPRHTCFRYVQPHLRRVQFRPSEADQRDYALESVADYPSSSRPAAFRHPRFLLRSYHEFFDLSAGGLSGATRGPRRSRTRRYRCPAGSLAQPPPTPPGRRR